MVDRADGQICRRCLRRFDGLRCEFCTVDCRQSAAAKADAIEQHCIECGASFTSRQVRLYCGKNCKLTHQRTSQPPELAAADNLPRRTPRYGAGMITSRGHLRRSPLSSPPIPEGTDHAN
jgi:hypothetical protein